MKILVIGLGKSGRAAYDLLLKEGGNVVGTDDNVELLQKLESEGLSVQTHPQVEEFDLVVVSPGVSPTHPLYTKAIELEKEITGEAELALSRLHQPCIAITGTNGKTTVTLLTEHILKSSGLKACALGNVGMPLASYQGEPQEIMVVELSSFQLELMKTPVVDIGIILNITPDHLDRYTIPKLSQILTLDKASASDLQQAQPLRKQAMFKNMADARSCEDEDAGAVQSQNLRQFRYAMEEYAKAKCRLQDLIKGSFWVHETVESDFKPLLKSNYQTYGTDCKSTSWTDRISLRSGEKIETILPIRYRNLGDHESENILAAWIVCKKFGVSSAAFLAGLETFKKPAHRIEFVATLDGVDYFNDSKGTNIDATIKAVEAMTKDVVLIVGGVDKGSSYAPWKKSFAGKVKQVFAIGQAAAKIAQELRPEFEVEIVPTLQEAVECARARAKEGMSVLLSPGCSSYDMFKDYAHRGDEFKKFVKSKRGEKLT